MGIMDRAIRALLLLDLLLTEAGEA